MAAPMQLEMVLVPTILCTIGGHGADHITKQDVANWLLKKHKKFPSDALQAMFAESDFRREGHLSAQALLAAIDGALSVLQTHTGR
jgi:hypothetical protein